MAIGGALRAALRAGNWARTAVESRRRARALADLNARGGIRGTGRMNTSLERGIDDATWARGPRGNEVFINPSTGARRVPFDPRMTQMQRGSNPIEAPYEGFRVWPRINYDGMRYGNPGPWMGRGRAPWDVYADQGYMGANRAPAGWPFEQYNMMGNPTNVPSAFRGDANYNLSF